MGKAKTKEAEVERVRKIREANLGEKNPMYGVHICGKDSPMYGIKLSERHKNNISLSLIGHITREDTKIKMKNNHSGGVKYHTESTKQDIKKSMLGKNKGKIRSDEFKRKYKEFRRTLILPKKNTKPEVKIQNFLKELKIEFLTHQYMHIEHGYQCDIFIPVQERIVKNTIIECFGDYYHCNPNKYNKYYLCFKGGITAEERWNLDNLRAKELIENGYRVIIFWEHEIKKMQIEDLREKLKI